VIKPLSRTFQALRHPGGRVLSGSASLPSLRDRLRRPPAYSCGSRAATVTPGPRSTAGRSCRIARWFADGSVLVFARPGPRETRGDQSGKGLVSGGRYAANVIEPPVPRFGESLSPFPFPLPSGRGQRRVDLGKKTATAGYAWPAPPVSFGPISTACGRACYSNL
jgi:hypothetical protein